MKLKPKVLRKKKKKKHSNSYPEENNPFLEKKLKKKEKITAVNNEGPSQVSSDKIKEKKNKVKKKVKHKENKKLKKLEGKRERAISTVLLESEEKIINVRRKTILQKSIDEIEEKPQNGKFHKKHKFKSSPKLKKEKVLKPKNKLHGGNIVLKENDEEEAKPTNFEKKTIDKDHSDISNLSKQPKQTVEATAKIDDVENDTNSQQTWSAHKSNFTNVEKNEVVSSEITNKDEESNKTRQIMNITRARRRSNTAESKNQNYEPKNPFEEDFEEIEHLKLEKKNTLLGGSAEKSKVQKQRGNIRRHRTSSIVISSRERKKKKRLKIIKKLKKKKNIPNPEPKPEKQDISSKPTPTQRPAMNAAELQQEMKEIQNIVSDKVLEGLLSRQNHLNSLLDKSESLEDFAGKFAKNNHDILRKKKTQNKCCGWFSRSRFCWFLCTCDRELKLKKKKREVLNENTKPVVASRAYADEVVEENEAYEKAESSSLPNLSRPVLLRNKNNSNCKAVIARNSNASKTSSTSLLAAVQNRRMLSQLNRTSLPLVGGARFSSLNRKNGARKSSSVDDGLNLKERSPLLNTEARRSIQDHMNRYEDHDQKQKVYELMLMDYH